MGTLGLGCVALGAGWRERIMKEMSDEGALLKA